MSDVFISYARSTAAQADRMTEALRGLGYKVWRDDQLPAHLTYGEVIEERLHEAKAVVVIWSADALQSVWVRSEADRARSLRKLVQATVDGSRLPMPFDQIQCADLADWAGETDHKGFRKVTESLEQLVTEREVPVRTPSTPTAAIAEPQPVGSPSEAAGEAGKPPEVAEPLAAAPPVDPPQDASPPTASEPSPAAAPSRVREDETLRLAAEPVGAAVGREVRVATAEPASAPAAPRRRTEPQMALIGLGAAAAVILAVGGVWLASGGIRRHAVAAPADVSAKPMLALALAPIPNGVDDQRISQAAAGLSGEARSLGRPVAESDSLTQLATRINALLAQLKSPSTRPGGASSVAALTAQLNQIASQGSLGEASTLSRAGDAMVAEAQNTLRGDGAPAGAAPALAALRESTRKLHAAAASPEYARDAAASLAALHTAFAAWRQARVDYANATALYPAVLRARFQVAAEAARAAAQRVLAAAKGPKPWLFASSSQKHAYTVLQANAATAKADLAQLDALSQTVASSNRESQLRAAIRQVGEIRSSLGALAMSANAPSSGG